MIQEFVAAEREPVPAWLVEHLCTTDSLAFAGGIEAQATEPDLWASASTLDVPVLLLLGVDDDGQRETALGRQLVQALPARRVGDARCCAPRDVPPRGPDVASGRTILERGQPATLRFTLGCSSAPA